MLIDNPASGRRRERKPEQLQCVQSALTRRGHEVTVWHTAGPGTASAQARNAARSGADIVFACGGDGTVHEVLQGLVDESGGSTTALGVVPMGSANALARSLGLSLDPASAALQQIDGEPRMLPVGKLSFANEFRYFMAMAGAGPDGALVYSLLAGEKAVLGRSAYYLHAARLFAMKRFHPFAVEYCDAGSGVVHQQQAVSVMAVRIGDLGGPFRKLTRPDVLLDDATLPLWILGPPASLSLPLWFVTGWLNAHRANPFLKAVQVTSFSCEPLPGREVHFQADGEWLGRLPFRVGMVPNAVRMMLPRQFITGSRGGLSSAPASPGSVST